MVGGFYPPSDAIIEIYKKTELWKYLEKKNLNILIFHLKIDFLR